MIALSHISVFINDDTEVKAANGTVDIEIGGAYPDDAQLQFFSTDPEPYRALRDFFHSCALACEAALADMEPKKS